MKYTGVILAAGAGNRVDPLSLYFPKPLLPICNKPIMEYQVDSLKAAGITDIFIVVGKSKQHIINYFGDGSAFGVSIKYVEQEAPQGIAHALGLLESSLNTPFVLFLGDIFGKYKPLRDMVAVFEEKNASGVLAVKYGEDRDAIKRNFSVLQDEKNQVYRVIEKPKFPPNNIKGCGIYLFRTNIFDAIRRTPRSLIKNEYEITDAIQIFIDDGNAVYSYPLVEWDCNITYPKDILLYNKRILLESNKDFLIHETSSIHKDAVISQSIVGQHVTIDYPICIKNTVILPHSHVQFRHDIEDAIVFNNLIIHISDLNEL